MKDDIMLVRNLSVVLAGNKSMHKEHIILAVLICSVLVVFQSRGCLLLLFGKCMLCRNCSQILRFVEKLKSWCYCSESLFKTVQF